MSALHVKGALFLQVSTCSYSADEFELVIRRYTFEVATLRSPPRLQ